MFTLAESSMNVVGGISGDAFECNGEEGSARRIDGKIRWSGWNFSRKFWLRSGRYLLRASSCNRAVELKIVAGELKMTDLRNKISEL